jgi:hypothetical protein
MTGYIKSELTEGAFRLFELALADAEIFTVELARYDTGLAKINDWFAHMTEISVPLSRIADTLPQERMFKIRGFLEKFIQRFDLAIEEAKAREGLLN